jgi:hypothetical protein
MAKGNLKKVTTGQVTGLPRTKKSVIKLTQERFRGFSRLAGFRQIWTRTDIEEMLEHPLWRAALHLAYFPLLTAKYSIDADDAPQKEFLTAWFDNYYRRFSKKILRQAFIWGYAAGELLYREKDGRWWPTDVIAPNHPTLVFDPGAGALRGFLYADYPEVPASKMIHFAREGDELSDPEGTPLPVEAFWTW